MYNAHSILPWWQQLPFIRDRVLRKQMVRVPDRSVKYPEAPPGPPEPWEFGPYYSPVAYGKDDLPSREAGVTVMMPYADDANLNGTHLGCPGGTCTDPTHPGGPHTALMIHHADRTYRLQQISTAALALGCLLSVVTLVREMRR